jgi:hypothetical protein
MPRRSRIQTAFRAHEVDGPFDFMDKALRWHVLVGFHEVHRKLNEEVVIVCSRHAFLPL